VVSIPKPRSRPNPSLRKNELPDFLRTWRLLIPMWWIRVPGCGN